MKKNILISQHIRFGVLFIVSSLLQVSCEGCRPEELERDRDSEIAKIAMNSLGIIGTINAGTINNSGPVVGIEGSITEKHIPETSKLCLLVIPKGTSVVKAIEEFQKNSKQELGYGDKKIARIPLSTSKGAVYYIKDVLEHEQGKIEGASAFVNQLPAGDYETCLLLHSSSRGTVFSNVQPLKILPPTNSVGGPSITMVDAKPEKDKMTQNTKIVAEAKINNVTDFAGVKGWFLFIKKGTITNAETIVADVLKSGKEFPTDAKFTSVAGGKAIVHLFQGAVAVDNKLENTDADPHKKLFEKGAIYTVCAFFVERNNVSGYPSYTLSDSKEIMIPKPEVELNIKEAKITALIKCLDVPSPAPSIDELSIKYAAAVKQVGTFKPQIGLLFVKDATVDSEVGSQKIKDLLGKGLTNNYYQDAGDVVYPINDIAKVDDTIIMPSVPLELGVTYHVYFFLLDGDGKGEVFLSKNEVAISVPNASLQAHGFETFKLSTKTGVQWKSLASDILGYQGDPGKRGSGFILLEDGKTLEASFLKEILANANADRSKDPLKMPKYSSQIGDVSCNFVDVKKDDGKFNLEDCLSVYSGLADKKTIQHVYQVVFGEHEVFWKTLTGEKMTFYPTDKPDRESIPINEKLWQNKSSYDHNKYRYLKFNEQDPDAKIVLFKVDNANKNNEVEFPYDATKDALFRDLLGCIIDGDDPNKVKNKIDSFIKKMKNP